MSRASTSKSSSASGTPRRPAMASRWITAFVDPPIAALTRIAFSNAALVMMAEGRRSSRTRPTMTWPARCAVSYRRASTAGQVAEYGSCTPSASAIDDMVDAVPIVMQCPFERAMQPSAKAHSSWVIRPATRSSSNRHTAVPEPTSVPWYLPLSIGPPVTITAGRSTLAAAISSPGVVLSHPDRSTTPSSGLARMSSSASMASRFRYSMAVGPVRGHAVCCHTTIGNIRALAGHAPGPFGINAVRVAYVSRVHDMGGQTGFGPVPVDENGEPAFHADWEARVYALATMLRRRGLFNSDELRSAIERLPPEQYLAASYYERWLGALEMLVAEKGVLP